MNRNLFCDLAQAFGLVSVMLFPPACEDIEPPAACVEVADCHPEQHDARCNDVSCINGACVIDQHDNGAECYASPAECQRGTCSSGVCDIGPGFEGTSCDKPHSNAVCTLGVCGAYPDEPSQPTCVDTDPCTIDSRDGGVCVFDPIPGCAP